MEQQWHYEETERLLKKAFELEIDPEVQDAMSDSELLKYHNRQMRIFSRALVHATLAK